LGGSNVRVTNQLCRNVIMQSCRTVAIEGLKMSVTPRIGGYACNCHVFVRRPSRVLSVAAD
jgi:hypothetical protein